MGTVFLENACRSKFTELVTDHVFRDENRNEGAAVMHVEGVTDEVGGDGGAARPGLDRFLNVALVELVDFLEELPLHERAFFE